MFFIAPVHTMLLFSKTAIQDSWLGYIFRFVAEGPGAQLFMLLMGISFALSSYKSNSVLLRRALTIFYFGLPAECSKIRDAVFVWTYAGELAAVPGGKK